MRLVALRFAYKLTKSWVRAQDQLDRDLVTQGSQGSPRDRPSELNEPLAPRIALRLPADTFVERIPYKVTRDYVVRVMANLARYGFLDGGEAGVPVLELTLPSR